MTAKSYLTKVQCLECHQEFEFFPGLDRCPECNGVWLDARYNYKTVAEIWKNGLPNRINSLWRFAELLPILDPKQIVSMGEGQTPLIQAKRTQERLGHPAIYIKDERLAPTSSFKDRQAAVAASAMQEAGIKECVLASNAGSSFIWG
jgi:threonine synthase